MFFFQKDSQTSPPSLSPKQQTSPSSVIVSFTNYPQLTCTNADSSPNLLALCHTPPRNSQNNPKQLSPILLEIKEPLTATTNTNTTASTKPHSTSPTNRRTMTQSDLLNVSKSQSNLSEDLLLLGSSNTADGVVLRKNLSRQGFRHAGSDGAMLANHIGQTDNMILFEVDPINGSNVPAGTVKRQVYRYINISRSEYIWK